MVNSIYYTESGKFSPVGIVLVIGGSAVAAAILGAIYAYATFYIPIIILNLFFTAALGAGVGYASGWLCRAGKIRSTKLSMLLGILAGLMALYFQWVFWTGLIFSDAAKAMGVESGGLIWSPLGLLEDIKSINEVGTWGMGEGESVSGVMLWIVWLVEAVIIMLAAWFTSRFFAGGPFCEGCNEWATRKEGAAHLALSDELGASLESIGDGYLEPLKTLPRTNRDDLGLARIDLNSCAGCAEFNTLDLVVVTHEYDKEGSPQKKETPVIGGLLMDSATMADLRAAWAAPIPAQPIGSGLPPQGGGNSVNTNMPNWDDFG